MIITITGPSCAGKSTLEKMLVTRGMVNAVSTTTRPKRAEDIDGVNYYFVSKSEFKCQQALGNYAESVEFDGNHYGLSVLEIKRIAAIHRPIVFVCEPVGQRQITKYCAEHDIEIFSVFVNNPQHVIGERFLRRFAGEIKRMGEIHHEKLITIHGARLAVMNDIELEWVDEALYNENRYDMVILEFNALNESDVVEQIVNDINGLHHPVEVAIEV